MTDELFFDGARYISASDAAGSSNLTRDYIVRLARSGKIVGKQVGRQWYVSQESLRTFLVAQEYANSQRRGALVRERQQEYGRMQAADTLPQKAIPASDARFSPVQIPAASDISSDLHRKLMSAAMRSGAQPTKQSASLEGSTSSQASLYNASPALELLHKGVAATLALLLVVGLYSAEGSLMSSSPEFVPGTRITPGSEVANVASALGGTFGNVANVFETGADALLAPLYGVQLAQNASPGVVEVQVTPSFLNSQPATSNTVNQTILENPIVERVVQSEQAVPSGGITQDELSQQLQQLDNKLSSQIFSAAASAPPFSGPAETTAVTTASFAQSNVIDNLANVTIENPSITGGSISGTDITANSLSVSGISGLGDLTAGSTTLSSATVSGGLTVDGDETVEGSLSIPGALSISSSTIDLLTSTFATSSFVSAIEASTTDLTWVDATGTNSILTNATSTNFFATTASSTNLFSEAASLGALDLSQLGEFAGGFLSGASSTVEGDFTATGDALVGGNLTVDGESITLGTSTSNSLVVNSAIESDLVPSENITYDLGSPSFYWNDAYVGNLNANNISAASTTIGGTSDNSFTINSGNATADTEDSSLIFFRGTVVPNAVLSWNSTTKRFEFNQPVYVSNQSDSTTESTFTLQGVAGQTGDIFDIASSSGTDVFSVGADGSVAIATSTVVALTAGTTTLTNISVTGGATSTFAGGLSVGGNLNFNGTLLQNNAPFISSQWTTSGSNIYYTAGNVGLGTTSPTNKLEVAGNTFLGGNLTATGTVAFNALGSGFVGSSNGTLYTFASSSITAASSTLLADKNTWTGLQNFSNATSTLLTATTAWIGTLNLTNALTPANGGTGISSTPSYGQLLVGNGTNYTLTATSSLGLQSQLQGSAGQIAYFSGTNSAVGTSTLFVSTASNVGVGTTSPTNKLEVAGNTFLGGNLTATGTVAFNALGSGFVGSSNGTLYTFASSSITAASSTLLADKNTWTGLQNFSNATSTLLTATTAWIGTLNLTNALTPANGGTGISSTPSYGQLLVGNGTNYTLTATSSLGLQSQLQGSAGQIAYFSGTNSAVGTSTLFVSTASNVGVGTTSPTNKLEVAGNTFLGGNLTATGTVAFNALGSGFVGSSNGTLYTFASSSITAASSTLLADKNTWTGLQNFSNATSTLLTATTAWIGTLNLTNALTPANGGTGISSTPSYGQLLVGNGTNYTLTATSSLGLQSQLQGSAGQIAYFSGTNSAVGTSTLFVSTASNVGVGTTSPFANLSVQTATNGTAFAIANSIGSTTFEVSTQNTSNNIFEVATSSGSAYFDITSAGLVGIGSTTPESTFSVVGAGCFSEGTGARSTCGTTPGDIYYNSGSTGGYDVAEDYVTSNTSVATGTIVMIDPSNPEQVTLATQGSQIMGAVSTAPGVVLGGAGMQQPGEIVWPVALAGRVPIVVNLEGGPINVGDPISVSSTPGVGTLATTTEWIVGTALQNATSTGSSATTTIDVFIKPALWFAPESLSLITSATSSATTTAQAAATAFFGGASSTLQQEISSLGSAVVQLFQNVVYASTGIFNKIYSQEVHTDELCISDSTGETCVTRAQLKQLLASAGTATQSSTSNSGPSSGASSGSSSTTSSSSTATDTPPVLQINGDNPATVDVGATYQDLGAIITAPQQDLNLGIEASVDGGATTTDDQIQIDTSQLGTHTIVYSATDQNGLTSYATRTVNVVATQSPDTSATSTVATSTSDDSDSSATTTTTLDATSTATSTTP